MSGKDEEGQSVFDALTDAALSGDASHAKALLNRLAEAFGSSSDEGPIWISGRDRRFLAVALRRIASDPPALNVACAANRSKGRKEKTGRPRESYRALNVALTVARHGSIRKAMAASAAQPWFPKDRRTVERMWNEHRATAERMWAESES